MKIISADFNAMTEAEHLRLNCKASQDDLRDAGVGIGDWAWFGDGELVVGGQLRHDPYWGFLGVPAWDTLVHLDDEGADDFGRVWGELQPLLDRASFSPEAEKRIFQLLTQLERVAPPGLFETEPGYFAMRRAMALQWLDRLGLALLEIEDARRDQVDDPGVNFLYLDLLRRQDLPRAASEAESFASAGNVPAIVLSACINILATRADEASEEQFPILARRIFDWFDRFEHAPDRGQVEPSLAAQNWFNRGLVLLREQNHSAASDSFHRAHEIYPIDPLFGEATRLRFYDQHARQLAARVRSRPVAA